MIPTDELLSDDEILDGLDVMVDVGDRVPDGEIEFHEMRVAFLEAMADWIDIMRAKEAEYDLDLDTHPSAVLKALGISCADRAKSSTDIWMKRFQVTSTFYDAAIWCHQQHIARRAQNQ